VSPFSSVGYYAAAAFGAEIAAAAASFVAEVDKLAVGAAASFAVAADRTNIAAVAFVAVAFVAFVQDIVVVGNCTAVVVELACYIPQPSYSSAAAAAYLDCCCTSVAGAGAGAGAGAADIGAVDMPSADPAAAPADPVVVVEVSGSCF